MADRATYQIFANEGDDTPIAEIDAPAGMSQEAAIAFAKMKSPELAATIGPIQARKRMIQIAQAGGNEPGGMLRSIAPDIVRGATSLIPSVAGMAAGAVGSGMASVPLGAGAGIAGEDVRSRINQAIFGDQPSGLAQMGIQGAIQGAAQIPGAVSLKGLTNFIRSFKTAARKAVEDLIGSEGAAQISRAAVPTAKSVGDLIGAKVTARGIKFGQDIAGTLKQEGIDLSADAIQLPKVAQQIQSAASSRTAQLETLLASSPKRIDISASVQNTLDAVANKFGGTSPELAALQGRIQNFLGNLEPTETHLSRMLRRTLLDQDTGAFASLDALSPLEVQMLRRDLGSAFATAGGKLGPSIRSLSNNLGKQIKQAVPNASDLFDTVAGLTEASKAASNAVLAQRVADQRAAMSTLPQSAALGQIPLRKAPPSFLARLATLAGVPASVAAQSNTPGP